MPHSLNHAEYIHPTAKNFTLKIELHTQCNSQAGFEHDAVTEIVILPNKAIHWSRNTLNEAGSAWFCAERREAVMV